MPVLVVRSRPMARSRAGFRFTREPTMVDATDEQAAIIRADAQLSIVEDSSAPAPTSVVEPVPVTEEKAAPKRK